MNFLHTLINLGRYCQKIDIAFDHYLKHSIKGGTRKKQSHSLRPIRRIIENAEVPLPKDWEGFLSLDENKQDLSEFLFELCDWKWS